METPPDIRNRVMRWYLVVQARRLLDAGYTGKDAANRLGIHPASITRWKNDTEMWQAAFEAPDHEAVGPPKKTTSTAFEALQEATKELEGQKNRNGTHETPKHATPTEPDTQHAEHDGPEPRKTTDPSLVKNGASMQRNDLQDSYLAPHQRDEPARGRYDGLTGTKVGARTAHHEADGSPLDVTAELALMRALIERLALGVETNDAVDLEAVKAVARLLDQISKMIHRVETIRAADAISRKDFMRFCGELGRALRLHCSEEQARKVAEHMMSLKV